MIDLLILANEFFDDFGETKSVKSSKRKIRKEELAAHIITSRWTGGAPVDISKLFAPEIDLGLIRFVWMNESECGGFAINIDKTETGLVFKFNRQLSRPDLRFAMAYAVARLYVEAEKAHEPINFVRLDKLDGTSPAYRFAVDLIVPRAAYLSALEMIFDEKWIRRAFGFGKKLPNHFQALLDIFCVPAHVLRYRVHEKKLANLG